MAKLLVLTNPTSPPKPIAFGVLDGDRVVAYLSYDQVKSALEHFEKLKEARPYSWVGESS